MASIAAQWCGGSEKERPIKTRAGDTAVRVYTWVVCVCRCIRVNWSMCVCVRVCTLYPWSGEEKIINAGINALAGTSCGVTSVRLSCRNS